MTRRLVLPTLGLSLAAFACSSAKHGAPRGADPWSEEFIPPVSFKTELVRLEPLSPDVVELDYAAFMGSREHLRRTLNWGTWPPADFTLAQNRRDLERHWAQFGMREAYAYTVLTPDRKQCVGCVYLYPSKREGTKPPSVTFLYWVTEPELRRGLDLHLCSSVVEWLRTDWPFSTIEVPVNVANERGILIAREIGLTEFGRSSRGEEIVFVGRR